MTHRPFDFTDSKIKPEARFRQLNLCACCGENLNDFYYEFGHHVFANQSGDPHNPDHSWIRDVVNCVILCRDCHHRVHQNGNTRSGSMAPPEYFPYSHGLDRARHFDWVREMKQKEKTIWP